MAQIIGFSINLALNMSSLLKSPPQTLSECRNVYSMLLDCAHERNKNITGNFCKTIAQIITAGVADKKSPPNKSITRHF